MRRLIKKLKRGDYRITDGVRLLWLKWRRRAWPCRRRQFLVVGCESSGTTILADLLLNNGRLRVLTAGGRWAWQLYMDVYRGRAKVQDYLRLQLYDGLKVPGFAAILDHYREAFPESKVLYVVRDPRDVLASAYRSKRVTDRAQLATISWVAEDWLSTPHIDPVARLAFRWRTYLEVASKVPNVLFVRYEDFCADKVETIRTLAEKLGLSFDLQRVRLDCDRQASHQSVRGYAPVGPGKNRQAFVSDTDEDIIAEICGDWMTKWGYLDAGTDQSNRPASMEK